MRAHTAVLRISLAAIATLAVAVPSWVVTHAPRMPARRVGVHLRHRVVPPTVVPDVEPTQFVDLSPEDARTYNASIPFVDGPNPAARPFRYAGATDDLARATDCLAAAVVYEAGDDAKGERAVAQVVLNRLRHPAFPKTVCGVVFQGSERATGCQFTFTCDGALTRWHPSEGAWRRAREVATMALAGSVFKPVGYATHYHTDWVVPYWQASLDKIAAVNTHLFFRWSGWWGTPPAFNRRLLPDEPSEPQLASLSDAHKGGASLPAADVPVIDAATLAGKPPAPLPSDPDTFLIALAPAPSPDSYHLLALQMCGDRPQCRVMGWTDRKALAPTTPLTTEQVASLSFSYLRDRAANIDKALWNCTEFKQMPASVCMKRQVLKAMPVDAAPPIQAGAGAVPAAALKGPAELPGVRRKPAPTPTPTPAATPTAHKTS